VTRRTFAIAGAVLVVGWALTLLIHPWSNERYTDIPIYARYAHSFLDGSMPYRDILFEYPPLAAPLMALPGLPGTDYETYRLTFAIVTLLLALGGVWLCGRLAELTGGDPRVAMLGAAAMPLLLGAQVRNHFDLAPVVLLLAALLALLRRRPVLGLGLLGAGVALKAFPLAAAPVALAWLWVRGDRRGLARGALAMAAVVAVVVGAAAALSAHGLEHSVTYQTDRPVQIESAPATALLALGAVDGAAPRVVHNHHADGLSAPRDGQSVAAFAVLGVLAVVALGVGAGAAAAGGGEEGDRALVLGSLAAVAAFAAFGKVLSPQFMMWVAPLFALALAWRRWVPAALAGGAMILTFVEFPSRYPGVVALDTFPTVVVAVRNVLLIALVGVSVAQLFAMRRRVTAPALT
jgi:glycosyl transferase family 87